MKHNKGYILLEYLVGISSILMITTILYTLLHTVITIKTSVADKAELQQQAIEITNQIEDVIGNSKGLINSNNYSSNFITTTSIKCKYKSEQTTIKDKEISHKIHNSKLFINTLSQSGASESGGYEIGDYIDKIQIAVNEDKTIVNIRLELSKNKEFYETQFTVYINNNEV